MSEPIDLAHRFEPPPLSRWREQVERDLGGRPADTLRWRSPDGVVVDPLYTTSEHERGVPGAPPFVRGSERAREWRIVHEPGEAWLESARVALAEGADGAWIGPDAGLEGAADLDALDALGAPVWIDGGERALPIAAAWLAAEPANVSVLCDPIGAAAGGRLAEAAIPILAQVVDRARAARPSARPVLVSARAYAEAGASVPDELALLVASGIDYLRRLSDAGQPLADLPRRMLFELALDADFFVGIAKLRAARLVWSKVLRTLGIDGPEQGMRVRACTARRALSLLDPQNNVLRGTAMAFAAVVGGAELVSVAPYDALSGASAHAERLARNTQLVLREEARLGRVLDPAGGSYFLEALTEQLARAAWSALQEIEHLGGIVRGLADGSVAERVQRGAEARAAASATRAHAAVGASRYPSPEAPAEERAHGRALPAPSGEPLRSLDDLIAAGGQPFASLAARIEASQVRAIEPMRDAAPFEALRTRAASLGDPRAIVIAVGDARALAPRVDFAREALEVAGLRVTTLPPQRSAADALAAIAELAPVVLPVASDDDYRAVLEVLAPALRERGARAIVAATPVALDELADAAVHRKCDLPAALGSILAALEAAR